MFHLNKPILSMTSSLIALLCGVVLVVGMWYLPEQRSIQAFFVLVPAILIFAMLGYSLGASSTSFQNSRAAICGYLIGGGILLTITISLLLPAF